MNTNLGPAPGQSPIDIHFDMETGDPDDVATLLILIAHPAYRLRSVSVSPGTDEQVGLVRHVLRHAGLDLPVGSARPQYDKRCVSGFHHAWLGPFSPGTPTAQSAEVLTDSLRAHPQLTLLTGAPLTGLRALEPVPTIARWVAQGGFAGDNVVPPQHRLPKFEGKVHCPTYNFNGDVHTAQRLLASEAVGTRILVSKNVCHGMVYDAAFHAAVLPLQGRHPAWDLLLQGMALYLERHEGGKKFHDPLAAAVAARPAICEFVEVELSRSGGGWGSHPQPGSRTWISVAADRGAFIDFLLEG